MSNDDTTVRAQGPSETDAHTAPAHPDGDERRRAMVRRAIQVGARLAVAGAIFSLGWYAGSRSAERPVNEVKVTVSRKPATVLPGTSTEPSPTEPAPANNGAGERPIPERDPAPPRAPSRDTTEPDKLFERARERLGQLGLLETRLSERCPGQDGTGDFKCYPTAPEFKELMVMLEEVRDTSTECISEDPTAFNCHLLLGTTYAKLARWTGDEERYPKLGAEHYRSFLKSAPKDHPKRHLVARMLRNFN
jgi:hypothetical protein